MKNGHTTLIDHPTVFLTKGIPFVLACSLILSLGANTMFADEKPLNVCLLSGCPTYDSEKSLPSFQQHLEEQYNVQCTRIVRKAVDDLPGLEKLSDYDVVLVFIKRMQLKGDQLEHFKGYMNSGKPIVAVRTASHAVQTWLAFDPDVLGGNYQGHYEKGPETTVTMVKQAVEHPILSGVQMSKAPGPLYKNSGHAKDIQILMTGRMKDHVEPIAWTRNHQGARVFYTSLGNVETFEQPAFRRMIANALYWTTDRKPELRVK